MKARNLVLGIVLAANVLTAQGDVFTTAATTAAITTANMAAMSSAASTTVASTVSSNMMNSQNSVIVECTLKKESVEKEGEWFGRVASYKKTIEDSCCQYNKKAMEQLNNVHYKFGKVKGIFDVRGTDHVMIELVEVNE